MVQGGSKRSLQGPDESPDVGFHEGGWGLDMPEGDTGESTFFARSVAGMGRARRRGVARLVQTQKRLQAPGRGRSVAMTARE